MKMIIRRLRRLENGFPPEMKGEDFRFVKPLLERRRRRLDANGEAFEEKPPESAARGN